MYGNYLDYPQIADYFQYSYKYIKFEVFKNTGLFQKKYYAKRVRMN